MKVISPTHTFCKLHFDGEICKCKFTQLAKRCNRNSTEHIHCRGRVEDLQNEHTVLGFFMAISTIIRCVESSPPFLWLPFVIFWLISLCTFMPHKSDRFYTIFLFFSLWEKNRTKLIPSKDLLNVVRLPLAASEQGAPLRIKLKWTCQIIFSVVHPAAYFTKVYTLAIYKR